MTAAILVAIGSMAPLAHAQEATPPPPAAAPAAAPPAERPLFAGTHLGIGSSFGVDSPVAFLAGSTESILWGIGAVFAYDGNAMTDKTHLSAVLSLGYMVHNQFPFAMGPEIDYIPQLSPSAFDANTFRAGWAFWYAPWSIPCVIGTAAFVNFDFVSGKSAVVTSLSPAVRIVFGFH